MLKIIAILQYPAIILALISLAYAFWTPSIDMQMEKRRLAARYACTHSNPPDWCDELSSDLAEGRRTRKTLDLLARTTTQATIPITTKEKP